MRNVNHAYFEEEILQAEPVELVRVLYRAAISAVKRAREFLVAGQIRERSSQITRACDILAGLSLGLDLERGGELAVRLDQLYDYMQRQLIEANVSQSVKPLDEIETLLRTLLDAWEACDRESQGGEEPARSRAIPAIQPMGELRTPYDFAARVDTRASTELSLA